MDINETTSLIVAKSILNSKKIRDHDVENGRGERFVYRGDAVRGFESKCIIVGITTIAILLVVIIIDLSIKALRIPDAPVFDPWTI